MKAFIVKNADKVPLYFVKIEQDDCCQDPMLSVPPCVITDNKFLSKHHGLDYWEPIPQRDDILDIYRMLCSVEPALPAIEQYDIDEIEEGVCTENPQHDNEDYYAYHHRIRAEVESNVNALAEQNLADNHVTYAMYHGGNRASSYVAYSGPSSRKTLGITEEPGNIKTQEWVDATITHIEHWINGDVWTIVWHKLTPINMTTEEAAKWGRFVTESDSAIRLDGIFYEMSDCDAVGGFVRDPYGPWEDEIRGHVGLDETDTISSI